MSKLFKIIFVFIMFFSITNLNAAKVNNYNGLRYFVFKDNSLKIGVINILIRAGSIFDKKGKYGTAYTLAAMLKKGGTAKYSTNQLLNKLDETGIELSTGCGKDFINIGIKYIYKEEDSAFDILEQVLFYPSFNMEQFETIKKEIIGRIISYQNNNDYIAVHQGAVNLIKNTEYSHSSFGEIEDIKNITISDLKEFYKRYFVNNNMIITFAGKVDEKSIKKFLNKNFKHRLAKNNIKEIYPVFTGKKGKIFKEKNLKQSYIYFLFPSCGLKSKDFYAVRVLSFLLGGNLTSILAERIRKEKGLAYSVFSTNFSMVNGGFFLIGMQTENKKRKDAIDTTLKILSNLKNRGLNKKSVNFAINYLTGRIPITLQSLSSIASYYNEGIFLKKSLPPWEYDTKMYKKVNITHLNNVIKKIFNFDKMIISIVGKK